MFCIFAQIGFTQFVPTRMWILPDMLHVPMPEVQNKDFIRKFSFPSWDEGPVVGQTGYPLIIWWAIKQFPQKAFVQRVSKHRAFGRAEISPRTVIGAIWRDMMFSSVLPAVHNVQRSLTSVSSTRYERKSLRPRISEISKTPQQA